MEFIEKGSLKSNTQELSYSKRHALYNTNDVSACGGKLNIHTNSDIDHAILMPTQTHVNFIVSCDVRTLQ